MADLTGYHLSLLSTKPKAQILQENTAGGLEKVKLEIEQCVAVTILTEAFFTFWKSPFLDQCVTR
jgi:hypothetical protein